MSKIEPVVEFNGDFSEPDATARPWADVDEVLASSEMFWLSTVRRDGRPHVTPLPAIWHEGVLHFCTGDAEQKSKNLRANPRCILTTGNNRLREGLDVVVEGTAIQITAEARLRELAALWKIKLDWTFEVDGGTFHDLDGRRGLVFGVAPTKILAFGKSPYSQTRFRFPA